MQVSLKNKIREVCESAGDTTAYQFMRRTGISQTAAYRLFEDNRRIPGETTLIKICTAYAVQPGDVLVAV